MQPEEARAAVARAGRIWTELAALYDRIDEQLATDGWASLEDEARRLDELRSELAPLVSAVAAARAGARTGSEMDRVWLRMAEHGRASAARHRDIERRVIEARAFVQSAFARAKRGRGQARHYDPPATPDKARFTSRRA